MQGDNNVKKISSHIAKKVADKLEELFKKERTQFQEKWDSLKLFIEYGMLTDDKFYDRAAKFSLLKNTEGEYFTFEEYKTLVSGSQTDKNGDIINLYCSNKQEQYSHIEAAKEKGYDVLLMDGQLDVHWVGLLEQKLEKLALLELIVILSTISYRKKTSKRLYYQINKRNTYPYYKSSTSCNRKTEFTVDFKALGESSRPVQIVQNEFSRRMKEMAAMQQQLAFYGELPDTYQVVLNTQHPSIKSLIDASKEKDKELLLKEITEDGKIKQMIDLALLSGGMLKGEALSNFVKRSFDMIK